MSVPVISFVAKSGTGKTTLLEKLIAELKRRGYRVGAMKHDAHQFDIDREGKDSWRLAQAGADTMVISSPTKLAMVKINEELKELSLTDIVASYFSDVDIVLTEGFKKSILPKIEVHRKERSNTLMCRGEEHDTTLIAVASDEKLNVDVPLFDINDFSGICDFIEERFLSCSGCTQLSGEIMMDNTNPDDIRKAVRKVYGEVAKHRMEINISNGDLSRCMGYSEEQLCDVPEEAHMGLGCGNPIAIASLKLGEVVLDLGSGGGFDCFQAAKQVGKKGKVIGVDMTPEMISEARENAREGGYANVEFRLGEIEYLPVQDESVDVIISDCVINLSPDKAHVFQEAFLVLKPGGRLAITDVVAITPLPEALRSDLSCIAECVAGAATVNEIENTLLAAGFKNIHVVAREESRELVRQWVPGGNLEDYILAATIQASKPQE